MLQYFARTLGLRQLSKTQLRGVRVRPGGVDTWLRCHRRAFEWFGGLAQVPGGRWRTRRLQAPQALVVSVDQEKSKPVSDLAELAHSGDDNPAAPTSATRARAAD